MKENLRVTRYADATEIEQGNGTSSYPRWYYPNDNSNNKPTYGLLYNWWAAMHLTPYTASGSSQVRGVCPTGWHIPNDDEWTQLTDYLSSQSLYVCDSNTTQIAKALASTTGWNSSTNICAIGNTPTNNNTTGFNALPAGRCYNSSSSLGGSAFYWSFKYYSFSHSCYYRYMTSTSPQVYRVQDQSSQDYGCSVRCVKD